MKPLLIIAGATGTGKSDIAIECAKIMNGEVVSADSMQIYRDLDIGTAKVLPEEMQGIKHHLIDIVSPEESFTVHDYQMAATDCISDIISRGKLPILCGGTGLYINSVIYDMSFSGTYDKVLREKLILEYNEIGKEKMHSRLAELDKEAAARLHPNDVKRVIRAIEKAMTGGTKEKDMEHPRYPYKMYLTDFPRDILYQRINTRVDKMMRNGLEKEIASLLKRGIGYDRQCMQAIAYKEWALSETESLTREEIVETIKKNTRNYAKRQITWFKQYHDATYIPVIDRSAREIAAFIAEDYKK